MTITSRAAVRSSSPSSSARIRASSSLSSRSASATAGVVAAAEVITASVRRGTDGRGVRALWTANKHLARDAAAFCGSAWAAPSTAAERLGIRRAQLHPQPGTARVGAEHPAARVHHAVEEHALDALMVVEILDVAQVRDRHTNVRVQVRRTVRRDVQAGAGGEGRRGEEAGDPAASGDVEL